MNGTEQQARQELFAALEALHGHGFSNGPALALAADDFETADGYVPAPGDVRFLSVSAPAEFLRRAAAVSEALSRAGGASGIDSVRLDGEFFGCVMGCSEETPDGAMDGPSPDGRYSVSALPDAGGLPWEMQEMLSAVEIGPRRISFYAPEEGFSSWWNPRIEVDRDDVPQILAACSPAEAEDGGPRP